MFQRMVGRLEGIRGRARSEQAAVTRKKVFEAQIGREVSLGCGDSAVIFGAMASQRQRLRLAHPLESLDVKAPEIPFCRGDVGAVRVQVLNSKSSDFRRAVAEVLQVPLGQREFRGVDGLDHEFLEGVFRSGKRRGRKKS